jgi:hypothetical protein
MKVTISNEAIAVRSWLRNKFQAMAEEITDVRVMADNVVPKGVWDRLKLGLGRARPEINLRAVIVWAGDKGVSLDVYHDQNFDSAVDWLKEHGWDINAAVASAIKTPYVRVVVSRAHGASSATRSTPAR